MAKILVVDDDEALQTLLKINFQLEGHTIVVASNGEEGLAAMRADRPDLVLLDVNMPVMGGLEMLKHVRDDKTISSVPVVLLSGTASEFDCAWAPGVGADDCVPKPFECSVLVRRVEALLDPLT